MRSLFWLYALAYQPAGATSVPAGLLHAGPSDEGPSADRLRKLRERIRDGFYGRTEVLDKIARPLTDDLLDEPSDKDTAGDSQTPGRT